ncbi:hypothetical protein DDF62_09575 [Caulobacter radicis]|uniref:hypothetical protein n=1 Tax=Caulobacter radicis TaxID=2172650 RepID=UPI000D58129A|nr:hypothetical protein [Caulobacter radicis]PVM90488.1 hypothetical protein DDF62_09575 [Caulobacter radicis]
MKLHPITWLLIASAGVQLAVLAVHVVGVAYAAGEASQMTVFVGDERAFVQSWLSRALGEVLQRLGGIVVNAGLAAWVEFLARTYRDLRAANALGDA